jgi:hypothetical protein
MLTATLTLTAMVCSSVPSFAQNANGEPPSGSSPTGPSPDIVRLKDGGFLRGTIIELVPKDHVDIQLPNGQTRRVAWSDLTFAGSAKTDAARNGTATPSSPPPAQGADEVTVELEADGAPELRLHVRVGQSEMTGVAWSGGRAVGVSAESRDYASLCVAPCTTRMPFGTHRLALSTLGGKAIEASEGVIISQPSTLHGHYESYSGVRALGWVVLGATLVGSAVLIATSFGDEQPAKCSSSGLSCSAPKSGLDEVRLGVGLGVLVVGSLVGALLLMKKDEVTFTVSPLTSASTRFERRPTLAGTYPQGLALSAHF